MKGDANASLRSECMEVLVAGGEPWSPGTHGGSWLQAAQVGVEMGCLVRILDVPLTRQVALGMHLLL